MWFSSGGTKSVLHNDDVDNINCLFSGTKELLFIDYKKYNKKVGHDHEVLIEIGKRMGVGGGCNQDQSGPHG